MLRKDGDSDRKTEKKCKKVCVEKVWVKPQSKFPKIFIVALSFLSIFPFLFYFIFFILLLKKKLSVSVKVVTANKMPKLKQLS